MLALEYDNDIVVIDCGVLFPKEDMLGVDLVIPDISYLLEHQDKVRAILITHGHEDHTGALPYVLPRLNVPVYAPRLAHGLIKIKLQRHGAHRGTHLEIIEPGVPLELGQFRAEFFRVCHSIPDSMGIALKTPLGTVIHTGDFKIDHTPVDGIPTDLTSLARYCADGTLLLLSDSTYAELPGYTPSEQVVGEALERVIADAPGRVLVTTFASLISRVQQVVDAAAKNGRKVAPVGRSMVDNINMSMKMGYLSVPEGLLISVGEAQQLRPDQVVLVTTGSQGEPTSALVRIANQDHREIQIIPDDTVVISATPIPGNEMLISRTIDNLYRQGARVLYGRVAMVHVHGHASGEELKIILNLTSPRYFVPIHGEYRHLMAHSELARAVGVPDAGVFVLEDGDVLEISPDGGQIVGTVPAGHIYVEGRRLRSTDSPVVRDRLLLSREGILMVIVRMDKVSGRLAGPPTIVSRGFTEPDGDAEALQKITQSVEEFLEHTALDLDDWYATKAKIKEMVSRVAYKETGRRPMIVAVGIEV